MKIFLSGIQPSGALHLGNYFGAMQPAIELQGQGQAVYFIADYHALTSVNKPELLRKYTFDVAAGFLACGLDPARTILFRQSDVPQVHELAWLLSVVTPLGLLERAHSYKDKVAQGAEMTHGLFAYPVLMAADILLYHADAVPVGKDQKQHLEIARDIAQKFNDRFGPVFKIPEPLIRETTAIVPGVEVVRQHAGAFRRGEGAGEKNHGHPHRFDAGGRSETGRRFDPRAVDADHRFAGAA
jgi:tryptophanyl-tRNA synthetase